MRLLEKKFDYRGFSYNQEWRDDKYAIYSQWLEGELVGYEAIIIRKNKEYERFGKIFPASESYPTDRQWGIFAWTYKNYYEAQAKIQNLASSKSVEARTTQETV